MQYHFAQFDTNASARKFEYLLSIESERAEEHESRSIKQAS
jgi:hypothetical protein